MDGGWPIRCATPAEPLIWIRLIDALDAHPLGGTDNAEFPFWSPDSKSLGYFANGKLMRIDAGGGPPQTVATPMAHAAEHGDHRARSFLAAAREAEQVTA